MAGTGQELESGTGDSTVVHLTTLLCGEDWGDSWNRLEVLREERTAVGTWTAMLGTTYRDAFEHLKRKFGSPRRLCWGCS